MPVVGHLFVGWATAVAVSPPFSRRIDSRTWWIPVLVVLAYVPDLAGNLLQIVAVADARKLSHSAAFAIAFSCAAGAGWRILRGGGAAGAFALTFVSVWLHDFTDLLQGSPTGRWWPLPGAADRLSFVLPDRIRAEVVVFGVLWMAIAAGSVLIRRHGAQEGRRRIRELTPTAIGCAVLTVMFGAAVAMNITRSRRDAELRVAARQISTGDHRAALLTLDRASRWPAFGRPGRMQYLRAEALALAGDRERAAIHYRHALEADPEYFWALADLALLYASSDEDVALRRLQTEPLVARMRREFPRHRALARMLRRIERELGT